MEDLSYILIQLAYRYNGNVLQAPSLNNLEIISKRSYKINFELRSARVVLVVVPALHITITPKIE